MVYTAERLGRRFRIGGADVVALSDVSLTIAPGELVAVTGPSGCGKSTLLQILGLLDAEHDGELWFAGADTRRLSAAARAHLRLQRIGFVFQRFHLIDALTVEQNVALPLWRLRGRRRPAEERARALLERFELLPRAGRLPRHLSVGEQQRAAVARALVCDPAVVLADEPTASLDERNAGRIADALLALPADGRAVVVATHDPLLIGRAQRRLQLDHGRLVPARL